MAATLAAERDEGLVVDELERAALEGTARDGTARDGTAMSRSARRDPSWR
jgi:hypothetical protein